MRRIRWEDTTEVDSVAKKLWDLTWGLVLVVGLTLISVCGLRLGYNKTPPDAPTQVSDPLIPVVK
jgi:hypothetical protein